ncbi:MAG TPA: hypothetical protein V6C88_01685 [Chroococcidiopsis sp.]
MVRHASIPPCILLASRSQYRSCHVEVPDLEQRMPAIVVGDRYYSFFKAVADGRKALSIAIKLIYRGDQIAIAQTSKTYGIWIWEPDARSVASARPARLSETPIAEPAPCKILITHDLYQSLTIKVPDLDQDVAAVTADGKYYSIFRVEPEADKLLEITAKIAQRGDETAIVKIDRGYAICIWEPDAQPVS